MASYHIGTLYTNKVGGNAYYNCYLMYDTITRSGEYITINNFRIEMYRGKSTYTVNRLAICMAVGNSENYVAHNVTVNEGHDASPATIVYNLGNYTYKTLESKVYIAGWCASTGYSNEWSNFQANSPISAGWNVDCPAAAPSWSSNPSVGSIQETSAILYAGYTDIGGTYQYSTNQNSWTNFSGSSVTLSGLSADSSYTYYVRCKGSSGLNSEVRTVSFSTYNYPHVTKISTNTLTAGNQQTITLYNPLKRNVSIYMSYSSYSTSNVLVSTTTTSTTAYVTPPLSTCASALGGSKSSGTAYYFCVYNNQKIAQVTGTYRITSSQANPTWNVSASNLISYRNTDTTIGQITSDLVQTWSQLAYTLNTSSYPATPRYSTSINHYEVSITGLASSYSDSTATVNSEVDTNLKVGASTAEVRISVVAVDNRGFKSSALTLAIPVVTYVSPSVKITAIRQGGYGTDIDIILEPTWAINNNNANYVTYQYSADGGNSWSAETSTAVFGQTITLSDMSNDIGYIFRARATDKLGTVGEYSQARVGIGEPIMLVDSETGGVGINCFPRGQGIYPKGTPIDENNPITTTYPGRLYGGGIQIHEVSNGNGPTTYGNLINIGGAGQGQLFISWNESQTTSNHISGHIWYRSWRNSVANRWSDWVELADSSNLVSLIFPVGAIYLSVVNTSPASFLGGTWTRLNDSYSNRYLRIGTGTNTGGSLRSSGNSGDTGSTKLTAAQSGVRGHTHDIDGNFGADFYVRHGKTEGTEIVAGGWNTSVTNSAGSWWNNGISTQSYGHAIDRVNIYGSIDAWSGTTSLNAESGHTHTLNNHSHTIEPSYYCVYAWRRTA